MWNHLAAVDVVGNSLAVTAELMESGWCTAMPWKRSWFSWSYPDGNILRRVHIYQSLLFLVVQSQHTDAQQWAFHFVVTQKTVYCFCAMVQAMTSMIPIDCWFWLTSFRQGQLKNWQCSVQQYQD
ncbi:hypothetical protein Pelo_14623 [Pelomyxa schiedti]|nr:hypothetical protein Pelo_14623 [Pelomyxa schiedti]